MSDKLKYLFSILRAHKEAGNSQIKVHEPSGVSQLNPPGLAAAFSKVIKISALMKEGNEPPLFSVSGEADEHAAMFIKNEQMCREDLEKPYRVWGSVYHYAVSYR